MDAIKEILLDCIEALIFLGVFEVLCTKRRFMIQNKIKTGLFCIFYILATYWSTFYIPKVYHTLFLSVFCILLLTYITKIKLFNSVVTFFLFSIIIFITENFTQIIEMFIFRVNLDEIFSNPLHLWIFVIIAKILQVFTVLTLFKFNSYFSKLKLFEKEGALFSNLILQVGIFSLFIFSANFSVFDNNNIKTYNALIFIMYFLFLALEFKDLKEKEKIVNISINYKIKKHQIENLEEIINIIRQEKHDFANHINVIQGLCLLNKPNTVERINNYVLKISDTIHSSFRYLDTGNDYIDGLLSIKNNYAMNNNIDFKVIINEPFNLIKIRQDELISIISNLVDNAFEAFQLKSNIENKEIHIATFKDGRNFCIEITDNGDAIPEDVAQKIFNKGFSTKIKKNDNHGFGLYITKQLVEKNNGIISLNSVAEKTTFLVKFEINE